MKSKKRFAMLRARQKNRSNLRTKVSPGSVITTTKTDRIWHGSIKKMSRSMSGPHHGVVDPDGQTKCWRDVG